MSATKRTVRKSTTRRSTTRRTTTRRATTTGRRTPRLATTLGAALGALLATFVLDTGWTTRILVVATALVLGLGYLLWSHRSEIAAGAADTPPRTTDPGEPGEPTDPTPGREQP